MKLRILIADDEPLARTRLRDLIRELGHMVCSEAAHGNEVEQACRDSHPDVVLLDIEMPGSDGLALTVRMKQQHPGIPVVLVTAHAEHAVRAFDVAVSDYVLKPVRRERLQRALERATERRNVDAGRNPLLRLTIGRLERLVRLDEIDYFAAEQGYVIARSASLEGFVDLRLHELEERFQSQLLRIHRSCLAVKNAIAGIEHRSSADHRLLFHDGLEPVPISRRKLRKVRNQLRDLP
ncbi:LytR/AlgR family response regulator transcription factor [Thioalkalivibrio paradoxus]|uniref:LytTR family transcriptional regulator n=1 Tax=Thioalkalivibrio paradoxus ARh 1 TaxID=713585 RepID=W0DF82_9GAMM|nr:LytTR family DNA-binding domain-containing protein [Thioalkalivibrio paradoxus]AHE97289.1 LytTR family transcriptional regulator [Thioalkalivibrio paradoxus ARh 1]